MYRDKDSFKAHFIEADIMSPESDPQLKLLKDGTDIISISAVLHQWSYEMQFECAKKLVSFSKQGTVVVGHQIGNVEAKDVTFGPMKVTTWRHNPDSFAKLWEEVGEATGTRWETQTRLLNFEALSWDPKDQTLLEDGARVIDFVVTRMQ